MSSWQQSRRRGYFLNNIERHHQGDIFFSATLKTQSKCIYRHGLLPRSRGVIIYFIVLVVQVLRIVYIGVIKIMPLLHFAFIAVHEHEGKLVLARRENRIFYVYIYVYVYIKKMSKYI